MTAPNQVIRIAARGDGVTLDGAHASGAVPGDIIEEDGRITWGPHHVEPACKHFGKCGGCELQHGDDEVLRRFVQERVVNAAEGQSLAIGELFEEHLSPPRSRRRAGLHALRVKGGAMVGYREAGAHRLVDLKECPVLLPELAALIDPFREFVAEHGPKGNVNLALTLCDQGVDLGLTNFPLNDLAATEAASDFAAEQALARLTIDQGYGPETHWEPQPVTVTLSGLPVPLPAGAFLQATLDAEASMIADASDWLGDARIIADLFSGLGTFAFALAKSPFEGRRVLAVEAQQATHLACKAAAAHTGSKVIALHRDLFRNPLQAAELNRFDAVLLDPPRAGAKSQIAEIAASELSKVLYVSCNPSSWARDGVALAQAGFSLKRLRPVGQFRWSTHVELVSLFER